MTTRIGSITISAAFASLMAFAPGAAAKAPVSITVTQEARETLNDVKALAAKVGDVASHIELISQNTLASREVQFEPLQAMKLDINKMGMEVATLEARRGSLAPWEQQALAKVQPLVKDAAAKATDAIAFYNNNPKGLWKQEYLGYSASVERDSDQIGKTLQTYLKYEKASEEKVQLRNAMGSAGN